MVERLRGSSARAAGLVLIVAAVLLPPVALSAADPPGPFQGRTLLEALQLLQSAGLRIVFSSSLVKPEMRVAAEPRPGSPRDVLDQLLAPHGLVASAGPGGVVQVLRRTKADRRHRDAAAPQPAARAAAPATGPAPDPSGRAGPGTFRERITVKPPRPDRREPAAAAEARLDVEDFDRLRGLLVDDPLRTVQTLPRVAAGDDFRSEFSVRGSGYRHIGVVIDGVSTRWLQHTAHTGRDSGSISMLGSEVLEEATLHAGVYPRRHAGSLGAQVSLSLREGSRRERRVRGAVSGMAGALMGEGPIGRSERGSWLVAARRSYLDWPTRRLGEEFNGIAFGFTDAQAKLVYDLRPGHQIGLTALAGESIVADGDDASPSPLAGSTNRAALVTAGLRSSLGPRTALSQRIYLLARQLRQTDARARLLGRQTGRDFGYQADVAREIPRGLVEAGAQLQRSQAAQHATVEGLAAAVAHPALFAARDARAAAWERSLFVHARWVVAPGLTLAPGLRTADSTLSSRAAVSRWLLGEWSFAPGWLLHASAGLVHQFPGMEHQLHVQPEARALAPERAALADVGIERRLSPSLRLQATWFVRRERDVLRLPAPTPRLEDGLAAMDPRGAAIDNGLAGRAQGVELLVERRAASRLSGWLAYSYGRTRYTDLESAESYFGDFDQRHTVNLTSVWRFSDRTSLTARFRTGSNVPIPGYLEARADGLYIGSRRNAVRLPPYARLDVSAHRTFHLRDRRLTLSIEALNLLDRRNSGPADGTIAFPTGRAAGFTEALLPRRLSAGIAIEF